jgi:threonine synthase
MNYYSTNHNTPDVDLKTAVTQGLALDRGLFMPRQIRSMPKEFFEEIGKMSFVELSTRVAEQFFGEDIPNDILGKIVADTLNFNTPLVKVS